jgi:hypothetical protein
LHLNPIFEDTINLRLALNSPCKNTGNPNINNPYGTRSDLGAWGGPRAYP